MAGPYDYTINIPQPPAQNFIQNLTGIMQLRQMQEQSALQQQQAGIAQQNAAFQQQMQPLERQRLEEQIKAQRAGTAASQTSQEAAKYELDQLKALDAELKGMSSDASKLTVDNVQNVAVRYHRLDPTLLTRVAEMRKNMSDQARTFGDNVAKDLVLTSVTGDSKAAIDQIDKRIEAAKNTAGLQDFVPRLEQLKQNFIDYPDQTVGLAAVGQLIFAPDNAKQITDVAAKQADIGKTKAETKKELAAAKIEESKLTVGGKEISDKQQADINALTDEAAAARVNVGGLTSAVDSLLNFAEQKPKEFATGIGAKAQQFKSFISGSTTEAQNLRAAIQPFATKEWIAKAAGLKGALNQAEGDRLDKGAPDVMKAGAGELLNWMRLIQKIELLDADKKDLSAAWQANARSLQSKAPTNFEVANVSVKPGDTYQQTLAKIVAGYKKKSQEDIQADTARLKRIEEANQSGGTPVPNMFNLGGAPQPQRTAPRPKLISIE